MKTLSRDECRVLRGLAIVGVALHNLCHLFPGAIGENEFGFDPGLPLRYFQSLLQYPRDIFTNTMSYWMGPYSVAIFIFLCGYGLVRKYEKDTGNVLRPWPFIGRSYLKLVFLLIPSMLSIAAFHLADWAIEGTSLKPMWMTLDQITLVNNIVLPWMVMVVGAWWYLGLAMQFYIVYALMVYRRCDYWLVALAIASVVMQSCASSVNAIGYAQCPTMEWLRNNCLGWMPVFAAGVWYGRAGDRLTAKWGRVLLAASLLLMVPCQLDQVLWQLTPLFGVVISIAVARAVTSSKRWSSKWMWIGAISGYIYISHPVLRFYLFRIFDYDEHAVPCGTTEVLILILYVLLLIPVALIYRWIDRALGHPLGRSSLSGLS